MRPIGVVSQYKRERGSGDVWGLLELVIYTEWGDFFQVRSGMNSAYYGGRRWEGGGFDKTKQLFGFLFFAYYFLGFDTCTPSLDFSRFILFSLCDIMTKPLLEE